MSEKIQQFRMTGDASQVPVNNCGNCRFAHTERVPQQIMSQLVCHFGPPMPCAVPAGGNAYQVLFLSSIVQPTQFCHRHEPKEAPSIHVEGETGLHKVT